MRAIFYPEGDGTSGNYTLLTRYEDVPGKNVVLNISTEHTKAGTISEQSHTLQEGMTRPGGKIWYELPFLPFVKPLPYQVTLALVINGNYAEEQSNTFFPSEFTQAEFNAAVQANVNAVVGTYQTQITQLQAQISQLQQGNVNLQQLEADGTILLPKRRTGAYTIKDFTVLNAIYRTGNPTFFNKRDLDFIDVQMLSVQQAVRKMYQVGVAKQNDLNTTAIFRRRSNRLEEYSATMEHDMVEYLFECVRIMNYCVDEIRFKQFFNLNNPTLLRIIEPERNAKKP